jgi:hypothetical protein
MEETKTMRGRRKLWHDQSIKWRSPERKGFSNEEIGRPKFGRQAL